MITPIMVSRMILSLKDAANEMTEPLSLAAVTDLGNRGTLADGSHGIPSRGISQIPALSDEEHIELGPVSRYHNPFSR